ncbi:MAG: ANTAR domain-containing protein [Betaproteobacteria bacterium]|nr:ANTAR domain-containing protein [Betaproteobacteria bacterium]
MPKSGIDRGVAGRMQRSTPDLLRNLRNMRVLVFHPKDVDGELLAQQLERIGCQVITMWPPLAELPEAVDSVFYAVRPDHTPVRCSWTEGEPPVPVIAVINYENPTVVDAALRLGASAVLITPLRPAGILSSLAMAKYQHAALRDSRRRIARLEQKLLSADHISTAKAILVRTRNVSGEEAYRIIREQAMSKRTATEDIARAIIHADGLLSYVSRGQR